MSTSASLFALIIGVSVYTYSNNGVEDLMYARSDAESVASFLADNLNVPQDNICLLVDESATRDNIINSIRSHLTENPRIGVGNPILFYFAGHGTRYPAPDSWPTDDNQCEAICPADRFYDYSGEGEFDPAAERDRVHGADISDRMLGGLFAELKSAKGDNVTVIMDCCHSGSVTRSVDPLEDGLHWRVASPIRSEAVRKTMFDEVIALGSSNTVKRHFKLPPTLHEADGSSHVLLSACAQSQRAAEWDKVGAGVFTHFLVETLQSLDISRQTYEDVRNALAAKFPQALQGLQTPQCEGKNRHRMLFNGNALGINSRLVTISRDGPSSFRIGAGSIHGITEGTIFMVWSTQFHATAKQLGEVVATRVEGIWSTATPTTFKADETTLSWSAGVTFWANEPFKVEFDFGQNDSHSQTELQQRIAALHRCKSFEDRGSRDVDIVETEIGEAELAVSSSSNQHISVRRKDLLTVKAECPNTWAGQVSSAQNHQDILNVIARFNFHLYRKNPIAVYRQHVTIQLVRLGYNGQPTGGDLLVDNVAKLEHEPDAEYGIILHNASKVDLFCSMYYFDPSDYSIQQMAAPPATHMRAPLHGEGKLTFGFGSSAVPPFEFTLHGNEDRDTGFVKVFLSDQFADLKMIEQGGFMYREPEEGTRGVEVTGAGDWDSVMAVIDVHR